MVLSARGAKVSVLAALSKTLLNRMRNPCLFIASKTSGSLVVVRIQLSSTSLSTLSEHSLTTVQNWFLASVAEMRAPGICPFWLSVISSGLIGLSERTKSFCPAKTRIYDGEAQSSSCFILPSISALAVPVMGKIQ